MTFSPQSLCIRWYKVWDINNVDFVIKKLELQILKNAFNWDPLEQLSALNFKEDIRRTPKKQFGGKFIFFRNNHIINFSDIASKQKPILLTEIEAT